MNAKNIPKPPKTVRDCFAASISISGKILPIVPAIVRKIASLGVTIAAAMATVEISPLVRTPTVICVWKFANCPAPLEIFDYGTGVDAFTLRNG
jgi:hypothetical protein